MKSCAKIAKNEVQIPTVLGGLKPTRFKTMVAEMEGWNSHETIFDLDVVAIRAMSTTMVGRNCCSPLMVPGVAPATLDTRFAVGSCKTAMEPLMQAAQITSDAELHAFIAMVRVREQGGDCVRVVHGVGPLHLMDVAVSRGLFVCGSSWGSAL